MTAMFLTQSSFNNSEFSILSSKLKAQYYVYEQKLAANSVVFLVITKRLYNFEKTS